jgi:hypothetical protein
VPVLNNVRYASDSDHSRYESELTLWARSGHSLFVQALNYAIACQHIRFVAGVAEKLNEYLARVLS